MIDWANAKYELLPAWLIRERAIRHKIDLVYSGSRIFAIRSELQKYEQELLELPEDGRLWVTPLRDRDSLGELVSFHVFIQEHFGEYDRGIVRHLISAFRRFGVPVEFGTNGHYLWALRSKLESALALVRSKADEMVFVTKSMLIKDVDYVSRLTESEHMKKIRLRTLRSRNRQRQRKLFQGYFDLKNSNPVQCYPEERMLFELMREAIRWMRANPSHETRSIIESCKQVIKNLMHPRRARLFGRTHAILLSDGDLSFS